MASGALTTSAAHTRPGRQRGTAHGRTGSRGRTDEHPGPPALGCTQSRHARHCGIDRRHGDRIGRPPQGGGDRCLMTVDDLDERRHRSEDALARVAV
jgi:hypothetical protein